MERFIPQEKLSKKARQELNKAKRKDWNGIRPVTRKIESKKRYRREKPSVLTDTDQTEGFLLSLSV